MDQATEATTTTASTPTTLEREHAAYQRAAQLLDRIVGKLTVLPRQAAVVGDLDGFRLRLNFGTNDPKGVLEFATIADVEASRDHSAGGVWFEARATIEDIPVCAEVLLSAEAAAVFGHQSPPPNPGPDATPAQAVVHPAPLGASVLTHVPAVTPVAPVNVEGLDVEDVARCVRCGCTEEAACEGGCYWVPNAQMVDLCSACATPEELQAMSYTAEISDGGQ
ncbi:hypothetical protein [Streptomyces sp. NPDC005799]|uniref:hypothetical protein n=1 Tax=Streptomyces sp. NPDC005799 TaxID=3154678 RepID=UPI0034075756